MVKPQHRPRGKGPLAALRLARRLSMPVAAARIGITPEHLWNLEHGRNSTRTGTVLAIARTYSVRPSVVFDALLALRNGSGNGTAARRKCAPRA